MDKSRNELIVQKSPVEAHNDARQQGTFYKLVTAIRGGHPGSLFSAFLYFDVSFMVWVILGSLGVYIAADFGLSATQKGLMVAIPLLGGAVLRIPMGMLTDWIGPKKAGLIGLAATMVPLVWGWLFARDLSQVMMLGMLLGVAGASFAVALPLASRWYPAEHQGIALGIAGAGNSGTVLAALFAPRLAEIVGWHNVLGFTLIPVLLTSGVFLWFAKDGAAFGRGAAAAKEQRPHRPFSFRGYLRILREPDVWWFNLFYGFTFGGFVGLASFLVIFFHEQYELGRVVAGNFAAACVFAGSFIRPVGGYLADRLGGVRVLMVVYAFAGVLLFCIGFLPSLGLVATLIFFGMMLLGMGNGSVFQLVPNRFGDKIGLVTGVVGAAGGMGGFFLPVLMGLGHDFTGSYSAGFFVLGMAMAMAFALLSFVYYRSWQRTWLEKTQPVSHPNLPDHVHPNMVSVSNDSWQQNVSSHRGLGR
jgi:NNP family nitrate/nitrite transporter-like MFS transporter